MVEQEFSLKKGVDLVPIFDSRSNEDPVFDNHFLPADTPISQKLADQQFESEHGSQIHMTEVTEKSEENDGSQYTSSVRTE